MAHALSSSDAQTASLIDREMPYGGHFVVISSLEPHTSIWAIITRKQRSI
jgi:hypothetical protein